MELISEINFIEVGNNNSDDRFNLIDSFLHSKKLSKNTRRAYFFDLKNLINFTDKKFEDFTDVDCINFRKFLEDKELSAATINRILIVAKSFFKWLVLIGKSDNYACWKVLKIKAFNNIKDRSLTQAEIDLIFTTLNNLPCKERNLALFGLMLNGLRPGEVVAVKLSDINFEEKYLTILEAKHNSVGKVPLFNDTLNYLQNYIDYRIKHEKEINSQDRLFKSYSTKKYLNNIGYDTIKNIVQQVRLTSDICFSAHQLRHTFATRILLDGLEPEHARVILRHKNVKDFQRYTIAAEQISAINAFNNKYNSSVIVDKKID